MSAFTAAKIMKNNENFSFSLHFCSQQLQPSPWHHTFSNFFSLLKNSPRRILFVEKMQMSRKKLFPSHGPRKTFHKYKDSESRNERKGMEWLENENIRFVNKLKIRNKCGKSHSEGWRWERVAQASGDDVSGGDGDGSRRRKFKVFILVRRLGRHQNHRLIPPSPHPHPLIFSTFYFVVRLSCRPSNSVLFLRPTVVFDSWRTTTLSQKQHRVWEKEWNEMKIRTFVDWTSWGTLKRNFNRFFFICVHKKKGRKIF